MVASCAAFGCTNRQFTKDSPHYSPGFHRRFHRFPLNKPNILRKWLLAVRRKDFIPTIHSRICGDHFKDDDYSTGKRYLKTSAVPSIFSFSSHFQCKYRKHRIVTEHSEIQKLKEYVERKHVLKDVAIPNIFNSDNLQNIEKEENVTIYPLIDKIQKLSTDKYVVVHVSTPTTKGDFACADQLAKSTSTPEINGSSYLVETTSTDS